MAFILALTAAVKVNVERLFKARNGHSDDHRNVKSIEEIAAEELMTVI